jgi:hypothetical protein
VKIGVILRKWQFFNAISLRNGTLSKRYNFNPKNMTTKEKTTWSVGSGHPNISLFVEMRPLCSQFKIKISLFVFFSRNFPLPQHKIQTEKSC